MHEIELNPNRKVSRKIMIQYQHFSHELSQLLALENNFDAALIISMYKLSQVMESERSSVFLLEARKQQLTIFSSLDLQKHEVGIPKSLGVVGWVFRNRKPIAINDVYEDKRFYKGVDDFTGFRTRNMICAPLIDRSGNCLGTIQTLNKKRGEFITGDLELLELAAQLVAAAVNSRRA